MKELEDIFIAILAYAERRNDCLRKSVGCAAITFDNFKPMTISIACNGSSRPDHLCSNIVGNCGCSHAEPRLVQNLLKIGNKIKDMPLIIICTYSPCTNCANIIIDSKLFKGCIYDILTEHDIRGTEFLKETMPILTRKEITESSNDKIKKWISDTIS